MKRRRAASVLIGLALVVGAAATWFAARRNDARLVGTWRTPEAEYPMAIEAWTFNADGTGQASSWMQYSETSRKGSGLSRRFRWWTSGNRLFVRPSRSNGLIGLLLEEAAAVARLRHARPDEHEIGIESDRLLLRSVGWSRPIELVRVAEEPASAEQR